MAAPAGSTDDRRPGGTRPGQILKGRYRLVAPVSAEPRTEVWTADDEVLGRTVLVKFLHIEPGDSGARERFRREALGVARLAHPGIVAVYDTILEGSTAGLVLEHVQATPLSRFMHDGGSVSRAEAVSIAMQVADALEAAHHNGVRHRNLSADSVWLCSDQRVKITDFGATWQGGTGAADPAATTAEEEAADVRALALLLKDCLGAAAPAERIAEPLAEFVERIVTPGHGDGPTSVATARALLADALGSSPAPGRSWVEFPPGEIEAAGTRRPPDAVQQRPRRRVRLVPFLVAAAVAAIALSVALLTGDNEPSTVTAPPIAPAAVLDDQPSPGADDPPVASPPETAEDQDGDTIEGESAGPESTASDAAGDAGSEADPGVAIVDVRIITFRDDGAADGDPDALRTLDGDESTYWATPGLSAGDATVNGVGLEFQLAETTAVARMLVISDTAGWVAATYVGDGDYSQLSDWGLLVDQQSITTGRIFLDLAGQETDSVLLWIPDPRSALTDEIRVAEVVISAASGAEVR